VARCVAAADPRARARALVAALVAAGAEGAELWVGPGIQGWRRIAAAGPAVPGAARTVASEDGAGYAGAVLVVRDEGASLVCGAPLPGTDGREALEDLAQALLALYAVLEDGPEDDGTGGSAPSPLPHRGPGT
jgi:hypothetical protein